MGEGLENPEEFCRIKPVSFIVQRDHWYHLVLICLQLRARELGVVKMFNPVWTAHWIPLRCRRRQRWITIYSPIELGHTTGGTTFLDTPKPIGSIYGIYANIGGILMVNVTIYSIHGSYGKCHSVDYISNYILIIASPIAPICCWQNQLQSLCGYHHIALEHHGVFKNLPSGYVLHSHGIDGP